MNKAIILVGAGGHAKVVASVASLNSYKLLGYLDDNPDLLHQQIFSYPVVGDTSYLNKNVVPAVLALGNNSTRKKIAEQYQNIEWVTLIHPTAYVHPSAKIGKGTVIFAGVIIQPDAVIGDHCIINTGATVDHDCIIDNYVHLAPGVHLAGNVSIGEGTFLGIGSVAIPGVKIDKWVTVAAGGVVIQNISANKIVIGVPAKEKI